MKANAAYGQSGGPTSVINASLYGVIKQCQLEEEIGTLFIMHNGIKGLINDDLKDVSEIEESEIELLPYTPSAICGSVRYKLKKHTEDETDYQKILENLKKHNIRYVFLNGGNDSMDTTHKLSEFLKENNYDCKVIGIPKTIDNDLEGTDHTPGYASAAKFIATSVKSFSYDNDCYPKGRVNIVEIMGRDTGWLTAASSLASLSGNGPDLLYIPELPFDVDSFLKDVEEVYKKKQRCLVAVSEGIKDAKGNFIMDEGAKDAFNHVQLGGVARTLANLVETHLHYSTRAIELSLLQRCFAPIVSSTDRNEAINCGKHAVKYALEGNDKVMIVMKRESDPYKINYETFSLANVANAIKYLPRSMMNEKGNNVTQEFIDYILPLCEGNDKVIEKNGIAMYADKSKF